MKRKQKRQKRIDLKKETEPGTLLFAFLGVLQVMLFSSPVRKGGGEEAEPDSTVSSFFLSRAASGGGTWIHAPGTVRTPPEVLPCNFWSFRDYFVIFNVIFIYLF